MMFFLFCHDRGYPWIRAVSVDSGWCSLCAANLGQVKVKAEREVRGNEAETWRRWWHSESPESLQSSYSSHRILIRLILPQHLEGSFSTGSIPLLKVDLKLDSVEA